MRRVRYIRNLCRTTQFSHFPFRASSGTANHLYDEVTKVSPVSDGIFTGFVTDQFSIKSAPNGGYLMGLALSAASASVPDSSPDPLSTTGYYFTRSEQNAIMDLRVEILAQSKSSITVAVRCSQNGDLRCKFLFTFGNFDRMKGLTKVNMQAPELPPIVECIDAMDILRQSLGSNGEMSISNQIELRVSKIDEFAKTVLSGKQGEVASLSGWGSFANNRPVCVSSLCQLCDCFPPPVLNIASFGWVPTLEYTVHYWNDPSQVSNHSYQQHLAGLPEGSPDHRTNWIRYRATTSFVQNGMCYLDNEVWSPCGGFLLSTSRQLARVMTSK